MTEATNDALVKELQERMERIPNDCIEYRLFKRCVSALAAGEQEAVADFSNRRTDSLDGWINELLTLAKHPDSMPGFVRNAIETIARGIQRHTPPDTRRLAGEHPDILWLYTHCKAIGMTRKSDSGKLVEDIALFTIDLSNTRRQVLEEAIKRVQQRRCTAPDEMESACNCCQHHWNAIERALAAQPKANDLHPGMMLHSGTDCPQPTKQKRDLLGQPVIGTAAQPVPVDGWNYDKPKQDGVDCRKFVTLKNGAMRWTGVRAWHHQGQYWMNNGEPCKDEIVVAWRDLPEPATGFWDNGKLHIPAIKEQK